MLKFLVKTAGIALVITATNAQANNGPIVPAQICEFFPLDCPSIELKPNAQASKANTQLNKTNR